MLSSRSENFSTPMLYWELHDYQGILIVQLADPPLNALGLAHWEELQRILTRLHADSAVGSAPRGIVITGSKKMFSVGARSYTTGDGGRLRRAQEVCARETIAQLREISQKLPTVAALSGYVIGEAWQLAQACRYRVMGDNARIAEQSGGDYLSADEALERDLVNELTGPDHVLDRAQQWILEAS